ncbi:MAG: hypothetical protein LR011_13510 [Verrucomicrobia bacterium]|nr:hypothetical protein [Verrucomicrobiota bacterium]
MSDIDEGQPPAGKEIGTNALMAIFFMVMNFMWIFPSMGSVMIFVKNPVGRVEGKVAMELFHIEHWIGIGILFLQLIFFNGWLMTRHWMPKTHSSKPIHEENQ